MCSYVTSGHLPRQIFLPDERRGRGDGADWLSVEPHHPHVIERTRDVRFFFNN